jgi:hypothetical protein
MARESPRAGVRWLGRSTLISPIDAHWKLRVPPHRTPGVDDFAPAPVDVPLGEAGQRFFKGDPGLEAGQRCAQAHVGTKAEGEVPFDLPLDVQTIGIGKLAGITSGGGLNEDDHPSFGDDVAVQLDISLRHAGQTERRRFVAQDLLTWPGSSRSSQ